MLLHAPASKWGGGGGGYSRIERWMRCRAGGCHFAILQFISGDKKDYISLFLGTFSYFVSLQTEKKSLSSARIVRGWNPKPQNILRAKCPFFYVSNIHCKKRLEISRPQPRDVTYQTLPGREKLNCLISDIPAGGRKIVNLFLQCILLACRHVRWEPRPQHILRAEPELSLRLQHHGHWLHVHHQEVCHLSLPSQESGWCKTALTELEF